MKKLSWILISAIALVLVSPVIYDFIVTKYILAQRNHTLMLSEDIGKLGTTIVFSDIERVQDGQKSLYPADNNITSKRSYLEFLQKELYIDLTDINIQDIDIVNISRSDPSHMVLLLSKGTMRDIHTMIHGVAGYPKYATGFLIYRKDHKRGFYEKSRENDSSLVSLPDRIPLYLE